MYVALLLIAASPFELELTTDLPTLLISAGISSAAFVELPAPPCLPDSCDASRINAFDRGVIGNYSEKIHTVADAVVFGTLLLPPLLTLLEHGTDGALQDTVVFFESILVAQALAQITKAAVRRPAPLVYDPDVPLEAKIDNADAVRSFYSGHTTTAFTAATAFSVTYWLRHPENPLRWLVIALGAVTATAVGVLKMEAGYHYPTDVIAGAFTGIGVGLVVPLLHLAASDAPGDTSSSSY